MMEIVIAVVKMIALCAFIAGFVIWEQGFNIKNE